MSGRSIITGASFPNFGSINFLHYKIYLYWQMFMDYECCKQWECMS